MHAVWPSNVLWPCSWPSSVSGTGHRLVLAQCSMTFMVTSDSESTWTLRFTSRTSSRLKLVTTWKLMTLGNVHKSCKHIDMHVRFLQVTKCRKRQFIACYSNSSGQTTFYMILAQYVCNCDELCNWSIGINDVIHSMVTYVCESCMIGVRANINKTIGAVTVCSWCMPGTLAWNVLGRCTRLYTIIR